MRRSTGITLVAVAAALWGTDALFRRPLAHSTSVATIVFGEHLVLVAITLPLLVPALLAVRRVDPPSQRFSSRRHSSTVTR
jgi:drug/metabolite transporter, DME family